MDHTNTFRARGSHDDDDDDSATYTPPSQDVSNLDLVLRRKRSFFPRVLQLAVE